MKQTKNQTLYLASCNLTLASYSGKIQDNNCKLVWSMMEKVEIRQLNIAKTAVQRQAYQYMNIYPTSWPFVGWEVTLSRCWNAECKNLPSWMQTVHLWPNLRWSTNNVHCNLCSITPSVCSKSNVWPNAWEHLHHFGIDIVHVWGSKRG